MNSISETWRRGQWPEDSNIKTDCSRIYLVCVFKDESILLEYFLQYHALLGFTHFLLIDNASSDNSLQIVKRSPCSNIILYQTRQSYKEASYGVDWVNCLLALHCKNQFCLVVDADELLLLNPIHKTGIAGVIEYMKCYNKNVLPLNVVDMYPKSSRETYIQCGNFIDSSPYFDHYNSEYYRQPRIIYDTFYHKTGGMRKRVFGVDVCIHKLSFFLYDFFPLEIAPGYHFFKNKEETIVSSSKIRLASFPSVILHFKFIKPDLAGFFQERIANNQDWDNSREYHAYMSRVSSDNILQFWCHEFSRKFCAIDDLEDFFGG